MRTVATYAPTFVRIDELILGATYFKFRMRENDSMAIDLPFQFTGSFTIIVRGFLTKMIRCAHWVNFGERWSSDCFAEDYGLLVGTKHYSEYPDNYSRTFLYTQETYAILGDVARTQNFAGYKMFAGERMVPSKGQQNRQTNLVALRVASFAKCEEMELREKQKGFLGNAYF